MWKDFFYYSKSERRAVYVLLVLIGCLVVALVVIPGRQSRLMTDGYEADSLELKEFAAEIKAKRARKPSRQVAERPVSLAPFDPNTADSIELSGLGLSPYVVRNVMKYREKGGRFPTPESFARIYGLTDGKFNELRPYIRISDAFVRKPPVRRVDTVKEKSVRPDFPVKAFKYPEGTLVDVNRADTTELKKIPGIGSGIARMIVAYRNRLGGYCSLEQLKEIKYVTPELMRWFKLEDVAVRKIAINRASLEKLRAHPYLNFYQAKLIVEYRRKKGNLKSLSQLSLYEEFTEKDLERLAAYVSFD